MIYLNDDFKKYWAGKNPFKEIKTLEGKVFREMKNRRTLRFEKSGRSYFIKIHRGVGWREIIKNLLMLKKPVIGARNEYEAVIKLEDLNVDTMKVVAFGETGTNPAKIESFIITEDLCDTISLEDYCKNWENCPPKFAIKKALIEYLANISSILNQNGITHRDYYICHFLLDISNGIENVSPANLKASLIDLHRTQLRKKTPLRWLIKDIGSLLFSAMDIGLTKADKIRFVKNYYNTDLRQLTESDIKFWFDVQKRAKKLYIKEFGE